MPKKKVTETDCQRLVKEIHTEERVKLEERFKEAYKKKVELVGCAKIERDQAKNCLRTAQDNFERHQSELKALEKADLDQWGKENPEPKPCILYGRDSNIAMSNMTATAVCMLEENHRDSLDSFRMAIDAMKKHPHFFQIPFPDSLL